MTAHHRCDGIEVGITEEVQDIRKKISDHKKCGGIGLIKVVGTNIAFSATGLKAVS